MLKPIDNGDYLDEKVSKNISIGDYEIRNDDLVAVYTESVDPKNFIAKFQWADLCQFVRKAANSHNIKYPVRMIRPANIGDDNLYFDINDTIKKSDAERQVDHMVNYNNIEKKFVAVVILGECDEKAINYMKEDQGAMGMHEVLHGSGIYRRT